MTRLDGLFKKLKILQNRLIPVNKTERDIFFQDVAFDNYTRLIFVGLAYFIFESWVLISSFRRQDADRTTVILLVLLHAVAFVTGLLCRKGKLRFSGIMSQVILTVYCIIVVSRGLLVSLEDLPRGGHITPLILSMTITSAFFYRRVLSTLLVNVSAFIYFTYRLTHIEWPLRPGLKPGQGGTMDSLVGGLPFLGGHEMKFFNDVMLITLVTCFLAILVVELRLKVFRENVELKGISKLDSMTKLLNHINIYDALSIEADRAKKNELPLSIVMLDIDFFKKVNDTYGHTVGDEVILSIADILKVQTRTSDYVGRYGGEEFMLVLTNTDLDKAKNLCERIRTVIEKRRFSYDIAITVSLGISQYDYVETSTSVVERADQALYMAKANGRNRTEINR